MTTYAKNTVVSTKETMKDIEDLVLKNHGNFIAFQDELTSGNVEFIIQNTKLRFSISYDKRSEFKSDDAFDQNKKEKWRALFLTIKGKFVSFTSKVEDFYMAFGMNTVQKDNRIAADHFLPAIASNALVVGSQAKKQTGLPSLT